MGIRPQRLAAVVAALLAAGALAAAPPALGDAGHTIVLRCTHGESLGGFPPGAYAQALKDLSATTEEYSDCGQLIRQAQLAASAGHSSGTGAAPAGGVAQAVAATPAEQRALSRAASAGSAPVDLGGRLIRPGVVHADVASALSTLPTPLVALIAFLAVCLLAYGGAFARKRIRDRRATD